MILDFVLILPCNIAKPLPFISHSKNKLDLSLWYGPTKAGEIKMISLYRIKSCSRCTRYNLDMNNNTANKG